MKKFFVSLLLALLPLSSFAAKLLIPAEFSVVRVNGEEFSSSFILQETEVNLTTGQNVLVLRYNELFKGDIDDSQQTIKSESFILLFSVANDNDLKFSFAKPIDKSAAQEFSKKPVVNILDRNGSKLAVINQSLSRYNDQVMQETMMRRQEVVKKSLESGDQTTFTKTGPNNLTMLKYWWSQASDMDKQEFIKHLNTTEQQQF
ncbi:MAG: DUF2057 family protein [Thalassotalea sp.]|nr:DUF2057 family protein [Thalassotalea sp.]